MTSGQRAVKYFAAVLAVVLVAAVVFGAISGITLIVKKFAGDENSTAPEIKVTSGNQDKENSTSEQSTYAPVPQGENVFAPEGSVNILEINAGAAEVNIKEGGSFYIVTDNRNINCNFQSSKVTVNTKHRNEDDKRAVTITVPEDKVFEKVIINAGAGAFNADELETKVLEMHIAAGDMYIKELEVKDRAQIDFAAGRLRVSDGEINNLSLNMAVGTLELDCDLPGKTDIVCGGGDINISLPGSMDKYSFECNTLLCMASVNGSRMERGTVYGSGTNRITVSGMAGNVTIKTDAE